MLNCADLVKALKLPDSNIELFESWNYSLLPELLPEESVLAASALKGGFIAGKLPACDSRAELLDRLETLAEKVLGNPALMDYYLFCNALAFNELASHKNFRPVQLPSLDELLGGVESKLWDLLLYFGAAAQWFETYRKLGVPEEYAASIIESLPLVLKNYREMNGCFGYPRQTLHWLGHYVQGTLFRIGRFEYMVREAAPWVPLAFRSNKTGQVVLMARHNWKMLGNGLRLPLDEPFAKADYSTRLLMTDKFVRGTYIDPTGFAMLDKEITLDLEEFKPMWQPGQLTAEIHIPGGGGMTMERCQASLKEAREFFWKYFGWKTPFFWCVSWVFNPDIAAELPESNIAELQKRVYLAPRDSTGDSGLGFVFGRSDGNWLDYPEETSLQRAFKRLITKGIPLKNGCMIIDDAGIDAFEVDFYRKRTINESESYQ